MEKIMQSRDDKENIVDATPIDVDDSESLKQLLNTARQKGAVSHTIGELPKTGAKFTINGLEFEVVSISVKKGTIHAKLIGT
jgi:hypothetical protein